MSITNLASDGLHSQMIVLARTLAKTGPIGRDDLISVCSAPSKMGDAAPDLAKLRASLARWLELNLFFLEDEKIRLSFPLRRGESLDSFTDRLAALCRPLVVKREHCLPFWPEEAKRSDEGTGRTADFVRSLSWVLAQDIYSLPSSWNDIQQLETSQIEDPKFIIFNGSRWSGFRVWARYLGFGTGEESKFFVDPTEAIRDELPSILKAGESLVADSFIDALAYRLPVLDRGEYRMMVEAEFLPNSRRELPDDHLSMSLSFALRRLEFEGILALDRKADVGKTLALTGRAYRTWGRFTHVRLLGEAK